MNVKYTDESIRLALTKWQRFNTGQPPAVNSIPSRFVDQSSDSTIFLIQHRPVNKLLLQFLKHWFLRVDGYEWHPGNSKCAIFKPAEDTSTTVTVAVHEKCGWCAYHYLLGKFDCDKKFNFFTLNCQVIVGYRAETVSVWISMITLLMFLLTSNILFLLVLLTVLFTNVVNNRRKNLVWMEQCKHIKNAVNLVSFI